MNLLAFLTFPELTKAGAREVEFAFRLVTQRNRNRNWDLTKLSQLGEPGGWEISGPHTDLELLEGLPWVWAQALPSIQGLWACSPSPEAPYHGADQGQPG